MMPTSTDSPVTASANAPFTSLAELQEFNDALLELQTQSSEALAAEVQERVREFVTRAIASGALLDTSRDRRVAQTLIDYWANVLYRVRQPVADQQLLPFDPEQAPTIPDALCPYVGLQAFDEPNARYFHGRSNLVNEMLGKLVTLETLGRHRLLAVVGSSGSGKSSVVLGGLLPAFDEADTLDTASLAGHENESGSWSAPHLVMVPGAHPLSNLSRAIRLLASQTKGDSLDPGLALKLETAEALFRLNPNALRDLLIELGVTGATLVIDQFEEIFTLCRDSEQQRFFADQLLGLSRISNPPDSTHYTVILTLRTDYEDAVTRLPELYEAFEVGRIDVRPMGFNELRAAIEQPALQLGLKFDDGIVDDMANTILGERAGLPLLQFTLLKLWERRQRNRITRDSYRRVGNPRQALERSADAFYEGLTSQNQDALKRILLKLITPNEKNLEFTSNRLPRAELYRNNVSYDRVDDVLDKLAQVRLIKRTAPGTSDEQVEVAHEALIRNWPRLTEWLEQSRNLMRQQQRLRDDAARWQTTGDAGLLLRGLPLAQAETLLDDLSSDDVVQRFVQASHAATQDEARAREQAHLREVQLAVERKSRARLQVLLVLAVVAALAAVGLAGLAVVARQQANSNLSMANERATQVAKSMIETEEQRRSSKSREWAAGVQSLMQLEPDAALLVAMRAIDQNDTPEAQQALRDALQGMGAYPVMLGGHTNYINMAEFSADGTKVVSASQDNTARIWDTATGRLLAVLKGHTGMINTASFSADGAKVVTASDDNTARIWDTATGGLLAVLTGHTSYVVSAVFSKDGTKVVTGSYDNTARVWDATTGHLRAELKGHTGIVSSAAFSADGAKVLTVSGDSTARVWDSTSGRVLVEFRGHTNRVNSAVFSADEARVVTASDDNTARVWDAVTGRLLTVLKGHTSGVQNAQFLTDEMKVVTVSDDGSVRVWDVVSGHLLSELKGHGSNFSGAAFSPNKGKFLIFGYGGSVEAEVRDTVTSRLLVKLGVGLTENVNNAMFSTDGTKLLTVGYDYSSGYSSYSAQVWDVATGKLLTDLSTKSLTSAKFSTEGMKVVTAGSDKVARVWQVDNNRLITELKGHTGVVNSADFSADGTKVLTASADQTARLWDAVTGRSLAELKGHTKAINNAAFSADGMKAVTASDDFTARVWEVATGRLLVELKGHTGIVSSAFFSSDGTRVVTAGGDNTARVWDVATGRSIAVLKGHTSNLNSAVFSADGAKIVTASNDGSARVWDAASGRLLTELKGHTGIVSSAYFSSDGTKVVTAGGDNTSRIWDVASGHMLVVLKGHTQSLNSAVFSADGKKVVTASNDNTARVWDAATGRLLAELKNHNEVVISAVFSADGNLVLTGSADGSARIWPLPLDRLIDLAKANVTRSLTCDEEVRLLYMRQECPTATPPPLTVTPEPTLTPWATVTPLPTSTPATGVSSQQITTQSLTSLSVTWQLSGGLNSGAVLTGDLHLTYIGGGSGGISQTQVEGRMLPALLKGKFGDGNLQQVTTYQLDEKTFHLLDQSQRVCLLSQGLFAPLELTMNTDNEQTALVGASLPALTGRSISDEFINGINTQRYELTPQIADTFGYALTNSGATATIKSGEVWLSKDKHQIVRLRLAGSGVPEIVDDPTYNGTFTVTLDALPADPNLKPQLPALCAISPIRVQ